MLSLKHLEIFNNCIFNEHALVQLDCHFCEIKITDATDLLALKEVCIKDGYEIEGRYNKNGNKYVGINLNPADMAIQDLFLKRLKDQYPDFWNYWEDEHLDQMIIISFPEK